MEDQLIKRFFTAADSLQPESFLQGLTHNPVWRFANTPAVHGREAVRGAV